MKKLAYSIKAGEFKAQCLKIMDIVFEKHLSYVITKRGKPVAKIVPIDAEPIQTFGCLKGSVHINSDIISPLPDSWEVNEGV